MNTTIKGPAIFVAQLAGDLAPFDTWPAIIGWAASLGYGGVQVPTWDVEYASLALRAALPAEARRAVDAVYTVGALGTGTDAARHKRLRYRALKKSVEDQASLKADVVGRSPEAAVAKGRALASLARLWGVCTRSHRGAASRRKAIHAVDRRH